MAMVGVSYAGCPGEFLLLLQIGDTTIHVTSLPVPAVVGMAIIFALEMPRRKMQADRLDLDLGLLVSAHMLLAASMALPPPRPMINPAGSLPSMPHLCAPFANLAPAPLRQRHCSQCQPFCNCSSACRKAHAVHASVTINARLPRQISQITQRFFAIGNFGRGEKPHM